MEANNHFFAIVFLLCRSEMVFLPDLSDGETSDGADGTGTGGVGGGTGGTLNFDDEELMTSAPNINSSNCNTLETMSARSFGFIKPSQKIRDNDMASRLRRHKSFFNADTSSSASVIGKVNRIFF